MASMRIFVYEFITGGGLIDRPLPPSLAREGDLMVGALLRDLRDVPGVQVLTTRDPRLPTPPAPIEVYVPRDVRQAALLFARCVEAADAAWIIAPESEGILERLSEQVLQRNRLLLGSRPDAIRIAGSKACTALALTQHGIPVVPVLDPCRPLAPFAGAAVLKPDDGAGCIDTRLYRDVRAALGAWEAAGRNTGVVLQPFVEGEPASLSLLARSGRAAILSVNRQHILLEEGSLAFRGCSVNALASWRHSLAPLAQSIAEALSGLWGYVGVDLVLSGAGPLVLEINPRVTTSYAGLRRAIDANPAALVLQLLDSDAPLPAAPAPVRSVRVGTEPEHVA